MNMQDVEALARRLNRAKPCSGVPGHRSYEVAKNQRTQWAYDCVMISDLLITKVPDLTRRQFLQLCGYEQEGRRHE